jgi:F-type H+-transporting ATPase subunit epsilon
MKLDVMARDRMIYSDEVDMVVLPAAEGEMGILEDHADFVIMLKRGSLHTHKGSEIKTIAIGDGYAEISKNRVLVLADAVDDVR